MITIEKNEPAKHKTATPTRKKRRLTQSAKITVQHQERLEAAAAQRGIPDWNVHWLLLDCALDQLESGAIHIKGRSKQADS